MRHIRKKFGSGIGCWSLALRNIFYIRSQKLLWFILRIMLNYLPPKKIFVFTHKLAFMQRIADYVRTGHQAYISGQTSAEKMHATFDKLVQAYPVFNDRLKAFRARKQGHPTGRLFMYQNLNYPEVIHWVLLMHARVDQLPGGEKWKHAEDSHQKIALTGYELVRVTKAGLSKPSWTWRYQPQRYQDLRDSIVLAIRSNRTQDLKVGIEKLFGTVGFSGSREQAKKIVLLLKEEWKLRHPKEPLPSMPPVVYWGRRTVDKGVFLIRALGNPPKTKERPVNEPSIITQLVAATALLASDNSASTTHQGQDHEHDPGQA